MAKGNKHMNKMWWMASAVVLLFVALAVGPVAASDVIPYPQNNHTYVPVANPPARFNSTPYGNPYYYVNLTNTTGGMNAIHITNFTPDANCQPGWLYNNTCYSGIYENKPASGTFYVSDTGGKGGEDDIILLVAVNSTQPENFTITVNASGYQWPPVDGGSIPTWAVFQSDAQYTSMSKTFTAADYLENNSADISQEWKFAPTWDYPVYNNQVMGANATRFKLMFIDLNVGVIGNQTKSSTGPAKPTYYLNLTDYGMVNVTYSMTNISSGDLVAFNVYAYNNKTITQKPDSLPPAINWLNRVYKVGDDDLIYTNSSGWMYGNSSS